MSKLQEVPDPELGGSAPDVGVGFAPTRLQLALLIGTPILCAGVAYWYYRRSRSESNTKPKSLGGKRTTANGKKRVTDVIDASSSDPNVIQLSMTTLALLIL